MTADVLCFWCGSPDGLIADWLVYPSAKGPVPEGTENQVPCCLACRSVREGRAVGAWLADCLESGRRVAPRVVYERLRNLDADQGTARTGVELRQLRRMLDMRYKPSAARRQRLSGLFERSGCRCIWCGRALSIQHMESSVEHLVPQSRQGNHHPDNLLPACIDCNSRRRSTPPAAWIDALVARGCQPRVDLVWEALLRLQDPARGIRLRTRAHAFQVELLALLDSGRLAGQPYLPSVPWTMPAPPPKIRRRRRS